MRRLAQEAGLSQRLVLAIVVAFAVATSACGAELRKAPARSVIGPDAGLSREAVTEVVRAHTPAVLACYEQVAKAEGRPMGVVRIEWHIEASGAVSGVQTVASTLHSAAVESCIADEVARWQFPGSPRATDVAEYPFTF